MSVKDPNVVVVEDDPDSRFVMLELLRVPTRIPNCWGYKSGKALFMALAAQPDRQIDLILLDIYLRDETAYSLLPQLRDHPQLRDAAIVIVTGFAGEEEMHKVEVAGFDGFFGKPVSPRQFPGQIIRILDGERMWVPR